MPDSPKCRKKNSHRPRGKPSTTRQAANKYATPTEPKPSSSTKDSSVLPAVLPKSPKKNKDKLPGVPTEQTLPDLVLEQGGTSYPEASHGADTTGTKEELDAAATLQSLGTIRDDTLEDDTENCQLMLIGGQNAPVDGAPKPIRLDQVSVDKAIAGCIQDEEVPDKPDKQKLDSTGLDAEKQETNEIKSATEKSPAVKGALKTKTYALKKKAISKCRSFKCSECKEVKKTIKN